MKLKLFVIPLLIPSFLNATVADHGFAVIERLRNSTTYPVQVSTKKTVHDRLPIESVVRIKSRKPEYGEDGRYYALRQDGGRYILRSDAIDSSDPATEFIVYRHLDKDLNDWLGFSSFAANRQMMRATKTQSVQFFGKDFENEESIGAHWKISGSNLIGCHLQSRLTKGFLSARSLDDARLDIAKYVRPEMPKIKFLDSKSFSKDKPRYKSYVKELKKDVFLSLGDLSVLARNPYEPWFTFKKFKPGFFKMGFSDAKATVKIRKKSNPFSVHEMLALINHTRRYILEKPTQVVSTVEGFGKEAEEARKRSFQENHQLLYGDKIRFVHHFTWQNLYANRDRFNHEGSSENMMTFCSNDDVNSEDSEFADSWWIVKGPHSDDDRFNCAIGTPVGNSATIRLEHVITGKNLRCQKTAPPSVIVGGIERQKHRYEVSIAGKDGIGTSYDNWTISFHDKAKQFNSGQLFLLNHVATGSSLFSDNEFFTSSGSSTNIVDDNSMWIVELTLGVTGEGRPVRFRDRVRFKNMTTGRYLHLQQHDSNVAATEDIQKEDTAIMWRIKGAHKKGDRWNCRNEQVESGAIIRLESSSNGKNLFIDPTFENPGLKTQQTMGPGIGNENDDWELKIIGKNQTLVDGSRVVLRHVQSRQKKVVREIAVNTSDELIAKEYIEKIAAKKPEKQSILQRVAALQLETEETKQMREEIRKLDDEDQKKQAALQKKAKARADKLTGEAKVKALEAIQEIKKPKSPRKKELEAKLTQHDHKLLWFVSDSSTSQVSAKDTAWTGVPYGSPAEQGPDELIDIEVVRLGRGAGVLPGRTVDIKVDLLTKPPTFSGFAIEKVLNFDSSFLLNLNPLLNKGAAWLERSLDTPGRASVAFMAQAKDKGDIQVLFGNELVLDYTWKIIIGANNNTETQIIRRSLKDG
ncbi:hypothetical protein KAU11_03555, partial [Candidatus Babeliales bacterium]|nr:hypothetical protein [Candidatus Babeliales bacterium]